MLEWGPHERHLRQIAATGVKVAALERASDLWPHLRPVWAAYLSLRGRRQYGSSPQALSCSDIVAWLDAHGHGRSTDRERWFELIASMDDAELRWKPERPTEK